MESEVVHYDCNTTETLSVSDAELQVIVLECSRLFMVLYDQHRGHLETTLIKLKETATHGHQIKTIYLIFGGLGGAVIGFAIGAVTGTLSGAFGAVFDVLVCTILGDVSQDHLDLIGTLGIGTGAAVGGAICGAVGGATEAVGGSVNSTVGLFACGVLGWIIGGAIGKVHAGDLGEVVGGISVAFGTLCGAGAAVCIFRGISIISSMVANQKKVEVISKTGKDLNYIIKPLVKELKTITDCDRHVMSFSSMVQSVVSQSGNTLAAVSKLSKTVTDIENLKGKVEVSVIIQQLPRQCEETREELEKMRALSVLLETSDV